MGQSLLDLTQPQGPAAQSGGGVHVSKIASDENLNGQPIEAYRALLAQCKGSIRLALQRVENGEMLKPHEMPMPIPVVTQIKKAAKPAAVNRADHPAPIATITAAGPTIPSAAYAAELAAGAKFRPGSPKYAAHQARLAALRGDK